MVASRDPDYLRWLLSGDLPPDVRDAVSAALARAGESKPPQKKGPG